MKIKYLAIPLILLALLPVLASAEIKPDLAEIVNRTPAEEKISVIILFHEKPTAEHINAIRVDVAVIKHQYSIIDGIAVILPAKAVEKISKHAFVKLVEPDYETEALLDKSIQQIQADKVWEFNITGKDIDVAILDTGIHDEHPALSVVKEVDFTGEGTDDLHGHGTHVAGIVASVDLTYRGVAFDANLMNVKVLNQYGTGYGSDLIAGIEWAVDNGAEIISMSLGAKVDPCDGTDALSQAVDKAVRKGLVAVVAAGNSGPESGTITSPGCCKKCITVGAVDDNDRVPSWSSRGPTDDGRVKPDLVAPGVGIKSTSKDDGFVDMSGTSMSTPHISGVAALLLQTNTNLLPSDILEILKSTAVDLGYDENTQGAGRVDAYEAYAYVANITEEEPELPQPGLLPDHPFYGLKRAFEAIGMFFTFDDLAKAERHVHFAELRLAEAQAMIGKGKPGYVPDLVEEYEVNVNRSNEIATVAQQIGRNVTKVNELVALATSVHLEVLERVYEKVPDVAKPAIERAMNVSVRGQEKALDRLGQDMPERSAELYFEFAEKRLTKAREKAREEKPEEAEELVGEYERKINKSQEMIERAEEAGRNITNITETVTIATSKHLEMLQEVKERVPEQAKPAIERATNVSTKGQEEALESLEEASPERAEEVKEQLPEEAQKRIEERKEEAKPEVTIPEQTEQAQPEQAQPEQAQPEQAQQATSPGRGR